MDWGMNSGSDEMKARNAFLDTLPGGSEISMSEWNSPSHADAADPKQVANHVLLF